MNPPTPQLYLTLEGTPCEHCGGAGCAECKGRGDAICRGCPVKEIGRGTWDLIEAAGFAANGAWPVAGGTQDQAAVFLKGCRMVWDREALMRAEMRLPPNG